MATEIILLGIIYLALVLLACAEGVYYITYYGKNYKVTQEDGKLYSKLFGKYGRYIRGDKTYNVFGHQLELQSFNRLAISEFCEGLR